MIEQRSVPDMSDERIQNICIDDKYYDISDVFWATQNPSVLTQIYDKSKNQLSSGKQLNRLEQYIQSNKQIS
jgi:hypothetical protein